MIFNIKFFCFKYSTTDPTPAPSLSTPDLLYHHHHVSHSTLPHPHHQNHHQMNHATAAATLNRYSSQHREVTFQQRQHSTTTTTGAQQLRYSFGNEYLFGDTQLGGSSAFEPMLSSTTIHNPNTLDGIIGPSAAATFIHGKLFPFSLLKFCYALRCLFSY